MSDKLREAAQAALDAMKLARGDHGTIMLAYPAIESWLYHRVDQRLDDAIKEVDDALAEATVKNSLTVQRPWVGLTDEEVNSIYEAIEKVVGDHWENGGTKLMFPVTLYEALEAKLREKNNDDAKQAGSTSAGSAGEGQEAADVGRRHDTA